MKKLSLVIAALALVLGISQCKKQEEPVGGKVITQKVTFTTSFGDGSKLNVEEGIGTLNLSWEEGDEITVTDGAGHSSTLNCTGVTDGGLTGTFTGEIVYETGELTFTVGSEDGLYENQHFIEITEDKICLKGTSEFKQSGDYGEISMELPYAILKVDLSELATAGGAVVSVKIDGAETSAATVANVKTDYYTVYLLLPLTVTEPTKTTLTFDNNNGKIITKSYTLAPNGFYTGGGNGGFAPIEPDTPTLPTGALSGLFTINGDGDKVYFSKGNLQFHTTDKIWQFADNQYDMCDASTVNHYTSDYAECSGKWIDLFGWGTSNYSYGATYYQPWNTNNQSTAYGPSSGDLSVSAKSDWGYNKISNGGNAEGKWRTLTMDEWCYLFAYDPVERETIETSPRYNLYKLGVTVCGKTNCVVLLPDDWDESVITLEDFAATTEYSEGTAVKWSVMEAAGAVCLPAAGLRDGTLIGMAGYNGYYWSSSSCGSDLACNVLFDDFMVVLDEAIGRGVGFSVRLVTEN